MHTHTRARTSTGRGAAGQVQRVAARLADKKIRLDLREGAVEFLAREGYDPVYGARPVKRAVQRELETGLAKALLRGEFEEEDTVVVDAPPPGQEGQGLVFSRGPRWEGALGALPAGSDNGGALAGAAA
jgi:ATP-dependent Clp protease ATP-binding subunit ClpB